MAPPCFDYTDGCDDDDDDAEVCIKVRTRDLKNPPWIKGDVPDWNENRSVECFCNLKGTERQESMEGSENSIQHVSVLSDNARGSGFLAAEVSEQMAGGLEKQQDQRGRKTKQSSETFRQGRNCFVMTLC